MVALLKLKESFGLQKVLFQVILCGRAESIPDSQKVFVCFRVILCGMAG